MRICGSIIEITTENGVRKYTADQGDAFIDLLYMLFPSPAGTLNTSTTFKRRDSFAVHGGISPELMAKFCAILNDYRNGKIKIPENFKKFVKTATVVVNKISVIDENFLNAVIWMEQREILSNIPGKKLSERLNEIEKKKAEIAKITKTDSEIKADLLKAKTDKALNSRQLLSWQKTLKDYTELINKVTNNKKNQEYQKARAYFNFINYLKEAVDLEKAKNSPYPKYLTERILMSYMIRTLNTTEDVKNLYHHIAEQLSKNVTSKEGSRDKKQAEIETQKDKIEELNDILRAAEYQKRSPYKSSTQANDLANKIGVPDGNGNVKIDFSSFADCADTAVWHIINLLLYSNYQDWDMLLPKGKTELTKLTENLEKVVSAIGSNGKVEFFSLETRLQMFFLYQRDKGVDDVTPEARTLWEYAICNMTEDTSEQFKIVYNGGNIELKTGYINQLKLMWNIAKALELGAEKDASGQTKLDLAHEKIDELSKKTAYDETAFMDVLNTTFSLFYPGEITCTLSGCKYENILGNNEVIGKVTVDIIKNGQKLNFAINQKNGHAEVNHTPIKFDKY